MLVDAVKRAQQEAAIRKAELDAYDRGHGFRNTSTLRQELHYTYGPCVVSKADYPTHSGFVPIQPEAKTPERYTRRNAEDIHD